VKLALPAVLVRIEGAVMLALSILLYGLNGNSWLLFVVLFLVPDLSMLGYLGGPRIGRSPTTSSTPTPRPACSRPLAFWPEAPC
jgi:Domain of unknown function (DUF4260)